MPTASEPVLPLNEFQRLILGWDEAQPFIGMTWQHWPIDGVSAAQLFRRVLARYVGAPVTGEDTATTLVAPAPGAIAPPWSAWRQFVITLSESIRELFAFSRIFPVPRP